MQPNPVSLDKFYNAFAGFDVGTAATCHVPDAKLDDDACALQRHGPLGTPRE